MATAEKEAKIEELKAIMAETKSFYLADFTGIDVASVTELRNKLRDADVQYQVIKNRLAIRAAEEGGHCRPQRALHWAYGYSLLKRRSHRTGQNPARLRHRWWENSNQDRLYGR